MRIYYPASSDGDAYRVRVFDTTVEFLHRPFFDHRHSDFELSFVLRGSGVYGLASGNREMKEGDVFIFGTNQPHCITDTFPGEQMMLFNVQFEPRMLWSPFSGITGAEYLGCFAGRCEKLSRDSGIYPAVAEKMREIRTEAIEKRDGFQLMIRACLCSIFALLVREKPRGDGETAIRRSSESLLGMNRAMTYINEHLEAPLTLGEIAGVAGFSRTYFSTLFTELNGLRPWDYITIRRIERSKELLAGTDKSVLSVAELCGYGNLSNFNRMFSRTVGMTPSVYRKSHTSRTEPGKS